MTLTPETIEKEVKKVFGDDILVKTEYAVNLDGVGVQVTKSTITGAIRATAFISGLQMLQVEDPIELLKDYINQLHQEFKLELKKRIDTDISNKMKGVSNAGPLWQGQLSQYRLTKDRKASE